MRRASLTKIRSGNEILDRIQDLWIEVLNPLISRGSIERYAIGKKPAASEKYLLTMVSEYTINSSETLYICLQNSDGSYAWVQLAQAPS